MGDAHLRYRKHLTRGDMLRASALTFSRVSPPVSMESSVIGARTANLKAFQTRSRTHRCSHPGPPRSIADAQAYAVKKKLHESTRATGGDVPLGGGVPFAVSSGN